MDLLFVRPDPGNERFGLGPFFRVEPLGIAYVVAALAPLGVSCTVVDERFGRATPHWLRKVKPRMVGIAGLHALEFDRILKVARQVKAWSPDTFVFLGGHAVSAYAGPLECDAVDAICMDDGETVVPTLVAAVRDGTPLAEVPALRLRTPAGWISTPTLTDRLSLDAVALPDRDCLARYRSRYHCLLFKPVWLVETARGCPFRCSFCSVWQLYDRSFRERSIGAVVEDFARCGDAVFVVDDLFWNHPARSRELARALKARGVRKRWILVQSRTDLVARHGDLLAEWRPLARDFDIFFGLEAASDEGLASVTKDTVANTSLEAAAVARELRYGVTGNFLVDPDWAEWQFEELWEFVAKNGFQKAGYTILTPLPGTELFERHYERIKDQPWFKYDMSHLLWEPRLGARRFFELYAETWRRSILNTSGEKRWIDWVRQVRPSQVPYILRVLHRTQRMMRPEAYLAEHDRSCAARQGSAATDSLAAGG